MGKRNKKNLNHEATCEDPIYKAQRSTVAIGIRQAKVIGPAQWPFS